MSENSPLPTQPQPGKKAFIQNNNNYGKQKNLHLYPSVCACACVFFLHREFRRWQHGIELNKIALNILIRNQVSRKSHLLTKGFCAACCVLMVRERVCFCFCFCFFTRVDIVNYRFVCLSLVNNGATCCLRLEIIQSSSASYQGRGVNFHIAEKIHTAPAK